MIKLGNITFSSPLILAPMASITSSPFRILMEELGAGGTVSELISCHGINYQNQHTLDMLKVDPREKNVGIQLFGEDIKAMSEAAQIAQEYGAKFIDLNMGCPVRKVVSKGGGSALLKDPPKVASLIAAIKKSIDIPLTIKIRKGWDDSSLNAHEIVNIAYNEGCEFVALHGRTRAQAYSGEADWDFIEDVASKAALPIVGNGDISSDNLEERLKNTNCKALMIGRAAMRDPFIFSDKKDATKQDYYKVILRLLDLLTEKIDRERALLVQMRKHIQWLSSGFPGASAFRRQLFDIETIDQLMNITQKMFNS